MTPDLTLPIPQEPFRSPEQFRKMRVSSSRSILQKSRSHEKREFRYSEIRSLDHFPPAALANKHPVFFQKVRSHRSADVDADVASRYFVASDDPYLSTNLKKVFLMCFWSTILILRVIKNKPKNRRIISATIRGDVERLKELSQERLGS